VVQIQRISEQPSIFFAPIFLQKLAIESNIFVDSVVSILSGFGGLPTPTCSLSLRMLFWCFSGVLATNSNGPVIQEGGTLLLKNWRPLSLINSDAKLFTRLLANRFNVVLPSLINPYQTGFMPDRLISDNG
jgi:hypothetical protein